MVEVTSTRAVPSLLTFPIYGMYAVLLSCQFRCNLLFKYLQNWPLLVGVPALPLNVKKKGGGGGCYPGDWIMHSHVGHVVRVSTSFLAGTYTITMVRIAAQNMNCCVAFSNAPQKLSFS
ncbi:hypothetical protein MTO96_016126 [Rhipicephalus appendiculatus]